MRYFGIKPESFGQLGVYERHITQRQTENVVIKTEFVRPYCVAYLDQVIRQHHQKSDRLTISSSYPSVNRYLEQCSFEYITPDSNLGEPFPSCHIVPLRQFVGTLNDIAPVVVCWLNETVKHHMPAQSSNLWKKITENCWEIVQNGITHGACVHGVSACGQAYPEMGYVELAFHDIGYGIPGRVKDFFKNADNIREDHECIAWAVENGNSTKPLNESGGGGLHFLREFIRLNEGVFQIVSGNGYFGECGGNPAVTTTLKNFIRGTLVNLRVIMDKRLYKLKGEKI